VKGQHPAVVKTLDILKRSVMGLTGAQARISGSRPRGVLFLQGRPVSVKRNWQKP